MNKKILWIDDDFFAIEGLFYSIRKEGYTVDDAQSALDGYHKAKNWKDYDLIVIDLIIPISQEETAPEMIKRWDNQENYEHVGIGLANWLLKELKVGCPVIILSVVPDPISTYKLENLGLAGYIRKSGLLPTNLKDELMRILKVGEGE